MLRALLPLDVIVEPTTFELPLDSRALLIRGGIVLGVVVATAIIFITKKRK